MVFTVGDYMVIYIGPLAISCVNIAGKNNPLIYSCCKLWYIFTREKEWEREREREREFHVFSLQEKKFF